MKIFFLLFPLLSIFLIKSFGQVLPQDDTIIHELTEIVISVDYLADELTPISFQSISAEAIENKNTGQEPSFLLSETPSMTVYSDAGSYQGYSYFRLRGIDQTRINMTLDGVPLNEPEDQGVYFSNYPDFFNSIDKVQIQRGVGTTTNGTSSYAGSLQFTSPNLYDPASTSFGVGYGSYNTYRVYGEHNNGVKNNKGLYVRGSHLHSDGYKERSANTSSSLFYSGGLFLEKNAIKLTGFVGNQQNQMAWLGVSLEDIDENPRTNANTTEDDTFTQSLTQLQHTWFIGNESSLRSSIFYNYLIGNYDFDLNNFNGLPSTNEMYNYAFASHFGGLFSNYTYESTHLQWTVGMHLNKYKRIHTGTERNEGLLYENTGFKNEFSAFTKVVWEVNTFVFFADFQYRHTNFDYIGTAPFTKVSWDFLNPKAGITYNVIKSLAVYYGIGRTGREPTRNDMFGGWDDLQIDSLGNAMLSITEPEYVTDHELGIRLSNKQFNTNFNFYYMDFENEIVLNGQFGPNGLALNSNVSQSFRTGVELDLVYNPLKKLKLISNFSFNHSQIRQQNETFHPILTPKVIFNQEVVYNLKKLEMGVSFRYQSGSYIDFANENSLDGYLLMNWRAKYQLNSWRLSAFVNNVTNTRYFNSGYVDYDGINKYFVQAPINFYCMMSYSF